MYGNFDSMVLLLDCLKRRENWPEEFISALEDCNYGTIAANIRREYDALRGSKLVFVLEEATRCAVVYRRNRADVTRVSLGTVAQ